MGDERGNRSPPFPFFDTLVTVMPAPALQRKQYQLFIDRAPEAVWSFLTNRENHARLCPPEMPEEILSGADATLADGSRIVLRAKRSDFTLQVERMIIYEVAECAPPLGYALRQVEGIFTAFIHRRKQIGRASCRERVCSTV